VVQNASREADEDLKEFEIDLLPDPAYHGESRTKMKAPYTKNRPATTASPSDRFTLCTALVPAKAAKRRP
jgi:hypothetical protein